MPMQGRRHTVYSEQKHQHGSGARQSADLLSRLRTSEEIYRYSEQEFLDRGYDYQLDFYLKGDRLAYVNISISVLGWSKRVQFEEL